MMVCWPVGGEEEEEKEEDERKKRKALVQWTIKEQPSANYHSAIVRFGTIYDTSSNLNI